MARGGNDNGNQQTEWLYIIIVILLVLVGWLLWTYARRYIVLPAFASNWLMIQAIELTRGIGARGAEIEDLIAGFFDGRRNPNHDITWANFAEIRQIVGLQVRVYVAALICLLAVLVTFKMKGDGYKRVFSLGGKNGPSLALEQAKLWKTATTSAMFDPDGRDKDILPSRTPTEWMRDNNVSFEKGELDRDAAERVFAEQLGKPWHGVRRADLPVQVVCILAGMHLIRNKEAMPARETINIAWAAGADGTKAMQELVAKASQNEKLISTIDRVCAKNAFSATAVITLIDLARRKSGVLPSSDFLWLRRIDRHLWYTINNIGRRRFHIEGAGAMAHFFAERVMGNQLPEPHVEEAVEGLLDYLNEHGLESLTLFFEMKDKEF